MITISITAVLKKKKKSMWWVRQSNFSVALNNNFTFIIRQHLH